MGVGWGTSNILETKQTNCSQAISWVVMLPGRWGWDGVDLSFTAMEGILFFYIFRTLTILIWYLNFITITSNERRMSVK